VKSIGTKIQQIDGLADTPDVTSWENEFIANVVEKTGCGKATAMLSERQIETVENIYRKHFGDSK
jgi:hypothetical protein